jgi:hypothetical protein
VTGSTVATVAAVATVAEAGKGGETGAETGAKVSCAVTALAGCKLVGTVLLAEAIVMTDPTAATESPPKIQASKLFLFFMERLSSAARTSATYLKEN